MLDGGVVDGGIIEVEASKAGEFGKVGKVLILEVMAVGEVEFLKIGHVGEMLKAFTGQSFGVPEIESFEVFETGQIGEALIIKVVVVADGEVGESFVGTNGLQALVGQGTDAADVELLEIGEVGESCDAFVRHREALVEVGIDQGFFAGKFLKCCIRETLGFHQVQLFERWREDETVPFVSPAEAHVEFFEIGKLGKGFGCGFVLDTNAAIEIERTEFGHGSDVLNGFFDAAVLAHIQVCKPGELFQGFQSFIIQGSPKAGEVQFPESLFVNQLLQTFASEVSAISQIQFLQLVIFDRFQQFDRFLSGSHVNSKDAEFG